MSGNVASGFSSICLLSLAALIISRVFSKAVGGKVDANVGNLVSAFTNSLCTMLDPLKS